MQKINLIISKAARLVAIIHINITCIIIQTLSLKPAKTIKKISILKMLATT